MATSVAAPNTSVTPQIDLENAVRPMTDNEVAFFIQNGWVLLRGLVRPEICRAMMEIGKPRLDHLIDANTPGNDTPGGKQMRIADSAGQGTITNIDQWCEWRGPVRAAQNPVFSSVALSQVMGRNVKRMLERERPMKIYHEMFVCKLPDQTSTATDFHQDATNFPLDRNALTVWTALEEITPDQAPVQFYSGSHRMGLLAGIPPSKDFDILDEYPELERFPKSPAHHMQPGDATVHHGLVVHGASANNTPRPRYSYICSYFPGDARHTGAPNHDTDGFGLKRGMTLDDPSFRVVPD